MIDKVDAIARAAPWNLPASNSSTRTVVAPEYGFESPEKKSPGNRPIRSG